MKRAHMNNYLLLVLLTLSLQVNAQRLSGIFQPSDAEYEYAEDLEWDEFVAQHEAFASQQYRLINVETTGVGDDRRYWGIFTQSTQQDTLVRTFGWADFVRAKRAMAAEGYLLTTVQGYSINEADAHFIGVWRREDTPHKIWKLDSEESLRQKTDEMAAQQYYIKDVEVLLTPSGAPSFLALYHYHPIPVRNYVFISQDEKSFTNDLWQRFQSKIRLVDYEQYNANTGSYFLGVYQPGSYEYQIVRNLDRSSFNGRWEQLERENLKLIAWEIRS